MTYGLTKTVEADTPALNHAEVKNYLRVDGTDDDLMLDILVGQAVEEAEKVTGRAMLTATFKFTLEDWPREAARPADQPYAPKGVYSRKLYLPRSPLVSVTSIEYYASGASTLSTLPAEQYLAITNHLQGFVYLKEDYDWPDLEPRPDAIQITFTAGHGTSTSYLPAQMRQAMLLLCRHYYAGGNPNTHNDPHSDFDKAQVLLEKNRVTAWTS